MRETEEGYFAYQHVCRLGTAETEGILEGTVYVFPKIDGTNGHIWNDGVTHFGSRRRELRDSDNAGFKAAMERDENICGFAEGMKGAHIFGEWLVPHTLRTYEEDAWRKFYVFDVYRDGKPLLYENYAPIARGYGVRCIPPMAVLENPTQEEIMELVGKNTYLTSEGVGEGIVLKNYDYVNKYRRQTWAKVVRSEFKEQVKRKVKTHKGALTESGIVQKYYTSDIPKKVYANLSVEDGWHDKFIPRLLETSYHDFVTECIWDILKKEKSPTINFHVLRRICTERTKELMKELF